MTPCNGGWRNAPTASLNEATNKLKNGWACIRLPYSFYRGRTAFYYGLRSPDNTMFRLISERTSKALRAAGVINV